MRLLEPDSATLIDIEHICEARSFSPSDRDRLTSYVTGAVRPNRDKPIWEACQLLARLADLYGADGRDTRAVVRESIAVILNPSPRLPDGYHGSNDELRPSYSHLKVLLAFLEFLFTHNGLVHFGEMEAEIAGLAEAEAGKDREARVKTAVSSISRYLHRYRVEHFPAAKYEKVFRAILTFLGNQDDRITVNLRFSDDDMLKFWEEALMAGERPLFRTVVSHFQIVATVSADLRDQSALNTIEALDASDWFLNNLTERADLVDRGDSPADRYRLLLEFLEDNGPEEVKALTKVQKRQLRELVDWGVFLPEFPLTILRILSFGAVQVGISNYLRRGSGGDDIAIRVRCRDASEYRALVADYETMKAHLDRLVAISAYAVFGGNEAAKRSERLEKIMETGKRELRRIKRTGFERPLDELKILLKPAVPALIGLREAVDTFLGATEAITDSKPLEIRFEDDRKRFAGALSHAYLPLEGGELNEASNVTANP